MRAFTFPQPHFERSEKSASERNEADEKDSSALFNNVSVTRFHVVSAFNKTSSSSSKDFAARRSAVSKPSEKRA